LKALKFQGSVWKSTNYYCTHLYLVNRNTSLVWKDAQYVKVDILLQFKHVVLLQYKIQHQWRSQPKHLGGVQNVW